MLQEGVNIPKTWQQEPEVGQKFWQEGVGSGIITGVDYKEKLVYVDFYEKGHRTYEFDEIFGLYESSLGGSWMLYNF